VKALTVLHSEEISNETTPAVKKVLRPPKFQKREIFSEEQRTIRMPGRKKPVMKDQGRFFWIITEKPLPGKEAGQNNRRLAQQEAPVECCEMGIISNDDSHLCFYTLDHSLPYPQK